jgi:hypothetical protein
MGVEIYRGAMARKISMLRQYTLPPLRDRPPVFDNIKLISRSQAASPSLIKILQQGDTGFRRVTMPTTLSRQRPPLLSAGSSPSLVPARLIPAVQPRRASFHPTTTTGVTCHSSNNVVPVGVLSPMPRRVNSASPVKLEAAVAEAVMHNT